MLDRFSFPHGLSKVFYSLTQKENKEYLKFTVLQENSFKLLLFAARV